MATKIGVYFDTSAIGGGLDIEALAEGVEARWSDLCPVIKIFANAASAASLKEINDDIAENELDGVVICGSSPRVDWDIYRFAGVQVERVSLREGCVLAYQNPDGSPADASSASKLLTMMAVDYINMGIIKLQKSNVPQPENHKGVRRILVIGGGWTGLTAAKAAAGIGYEVVLIEKEAMLGGRAVNFKKTIPLKPPHEVAHETGLDLKIAEITADENIRVFTSSKLAHLAGCPGEYTATITTPTGDEVIEIGSVVLSTGWQPQSTDVLAPLGYGISPHVVTTAQFEKMAKDGKVTAKRVAFILNTNNITANCCCTDATCPDGQCEATPAPATADVAASDPAAEAPAVVQQDLETTKHLSYSNAINSVVMLKQAGYVTEQDPTAVAYIIYDNMVTQGLHERYYKAAQNVPGVMLTKAEVSQVTTEGDNLVVSATNTLLGCDLDLVVDMVVLPTGMVPTTAKEPIMQFEYRQGPALPDLSLFDGFADSNYICFPYETRRTGVYAAGCVRQPMTLDAAEEDGFGAALKAIQCIESANKGVAVHPRSGDLSYPVFNFVRCTQCKRCTEECPFGALDDDEKGTPKPNPSRCRRCGTCMGACPERVISFDNYNIDQIGSMIRDIQVPDNMELDGPRVVILACENDAYPAFDMAAMRGKSWSPYVRVIPVRCLGSVNAIWVADAMSKGIDGVMLMGCKYGDDYQCHFVKGSEICNRRKENIAETLDRLGIEPDRVAQYQVAIDEYDKVPTMVEEFMKMIFEKGPNPFKGY